VIPRIRPFNTLEVGLQKLATMAQRRGEGTRFLYKLEWPNNPDSADSFSATDRLLRRMEDLGRVSRLNPSREEMQAGKLNGPCICYLVTSQPAIQLEEVMRSFPELLHSSVS